MPVFYVSMKKNRRTNQNDKNNVIPTCKARSYSAFKLEDVQMVDGLRVLMLSFRNLMGTKCSWVLSEARMVRTETVRGNSLCWKMILYFNRGKQIYGTRHSLIIVCEDL